MYIQLAMARKENMKYIIDTTIAAAMDWPVTSYAYFSTNLAVSCCISMMSRYQPSK